VNAYKTKTDIIIAAKETI